MARALGKSSLPPKPPPTTEARTRTLSSGRWKAWVSALWT
jgi:hypothetical protein